MQSLLHLNFLIEKADEQRILQDRKVAIVMIVQQIGEKQNPQHYFQSLLMQLICLAVRVEQHAYILDGCEEGQHV